MNAGFSLSRRVGGVEVFAWNPARTGQDGLPSLVNNFGDLLAEYLVERLAGPAVSLRPAPGDGPTLFTAGSVLHFVTGPAVVWGSGINFKVPDPMPRATDRLDVRAVRGPLTARALAAHGVVVPEVFGDPALLLPRLHPELLDWASRKQHAAVVVPNLNDLPGTSAEAHALGLPVIDPTAPLDHVLHAVAQSEFVVGNSLHAIVVADALGIPARLVTSTVEHPFKYRDYLAGTGRPGTVIASDLADALRLGGHEPVRADLDLLFEAFPRDLWSGRAAQAAAAPVRSERVILDAWARVMARTPPTAEQEVDEFLQQRLPRLSALADLALDSGSPDPLRDDAPAAAPYLAAFAAEAHWYTGLLRDLGPTSTAADEALRCLADDRPELFLRWRWLVRTGPHAVLQRAQVGSALVATIALRTGHLTNALHRVEIRFTSREGRVVAAAAPIFSMNAGQWSVEVTVAVPTEELQGSAWAVDALLDGEERLAVLATASPTLSGFPGWWDAPPPPWGLDLTTRHPEVD
ncbi:MAG: polysaccharide pyruvyl transferase family protein [Propionicimonas sp.]|nr:polysaccharide pyruvyl transferase family protein [Propionicimonas sp.]